MYASSFHGKTVTIDDIYIKACELFSSEGYCNVGMRRLASSVNLSAGSLYYHVESKQSILFDLIIAYEEGRVDVLRTTKICTSACHWFKLYWNNQVAFSAENLCAARLARDDFRHLSPEQIKSIESVRICMRKAFRSVIARYVPDTAADALCHDLWGMLHSINCLQLDGESHCGCVLSTYSGSCACTDRARGCVQFKGTFMTLTYPSYSYSQSFFGDKGMCGSLDSSFKNGLIV